MNPPSTYAKEAASLLGKQVRLGRKQRKWNEHELAERAGISRATLQKIEKGDLGCALGLVFEVAALVGVKLFNEEPSSIHRQLAHIDDKLALLPKSVRQSGGKVHDDF